MFKQRHGLWSGSSSISGSGSQDTDGHVEHRLNMLSRISNVVICVVIPQYERVISLLSCF